MHGREQANSQIRRPEPNRILRSSLRAVPGTVVVGLVSFICYGLGLKFPTVSFCFLIVVVLQSLIGDFLSSAVISLISFCSLNYFFVPPIFSMRVSDSSDTLALVAFLVAGLVITRLTTQTREAAVSEELQRRQMTHLYELARQLLQVQPEVKFGSQLLEPFRSNFGLRAVCLFDADAAEEHLTGESLAHLAETTRATYIGGRDFQDRGAGVAVRLLQAGGRTTGAIGFEGLRDLELAGPLTALATIMIERLRAFQQASHAAATTEAEVFRGSVLDALAHEFKTPLATILTAAGGLRETKLLGTERLALADAVESEASRLEQLTTRLLRLARLDREEVKPQMELIDLGEVTKSVVDQYSRRWRDRNLVLTDARVHVLGDRELLWLGLAQLLDNACKYSGPGAEIRVFIESADQTAAVRVWNSGSSIAPNEQAKIFERFYRGTEARGRTAGSGLGLYIARKIALAHGGAIALEPVESEDGTAFRFSIANVEGELDHDAKIQSISGG
jgi:two-component system, OmpR family, sensor histidine kinase KdpD